MKRYRLAVSYGDPLRNSCRGIMKDDPNGEWVKAEAHAKLVEELETEQSRHKSVIDAWRGERHAWFCTSQLCNVCNCPMKLVEAAIEAVNDWFDEPDTKTHTDVMDRLRDELPKNRTTSALEAEQ